MTTTTTSDTKEQVFQVCKDYIRTNNRGPRISVIEQETGLAQPRVSYYVRQLKDEGRLAFEAGNYESMRIVPQRRARRDNATKVTVVERRRPLALPARSVPDGEHAPMVPAAAAMTAPAAGFALKEEIVGLRAEWAKQIAAIDMVSLTFVAKPEGAAGDLLATPSQAVKDELTALRASKQRVLDALDVVIGALG